MNQESTQELVAAERHCLLLIAMGVVLPSEGNPTVVEGQQTMARDGDPVCVACKVLQYVLWPTEGLFRVHHPVCSV